MMKRCVALLGRPDTPTDAVEDYCRYLGDALEKHGLSLELQRVNWPEKGWRRALQEVRKKAEELSGSWFLMQYTALAWSRHGFPLRAPRLLQVLKNCGARCAVVFHDANPYPGSRLIDRVRRTLQIYVMRRALRLADLAILTIPPEKALWVSNNSQNIAFIPVGANLPFPDRAWRAQKGKNGEKTICAFSLSPGRVAEEEVELIAQTADYVAQKAVRLHLLLAGRNSIEAGKQLQQKLAGTPVQVIASGILPGEEVIQLFGTCHAMLFTRGPISSRRGSAIAGIACGLPVIGREGSETAAPITEAGVVLLPSGAKNEFGPALVRVLTDDSYRESLAERSRRAQEKYFSWNVISSQYVESLREAETRSSRHS